MVSDDLKLIFIHINKTAGTSIGSAIGLPRVHKTALVIKSEISQEKWDSYFKFAIVRNPWDRMVSMYNFRIKNEMMPDISFEDWIIESNNMRRLPCSEYCGPLCGPLWGPQADWISDGDSVLVDFVGKFENLEEDWNYVCRQINKPLKLPHENSTEHDPYQTYYNEVTANLVGDWHKKDIDLFGYKSVNCFLL